MTESPELFYKFSSIDYYLRQNVKESQIYFSDPSTFNDVFDCKIPVEWSGDFAKWQSFLRGSFSGFEDEQHVIGLLKTRMEEGAIERVGDDFVYSKKLISEDSLPRVSCFSSNC
jgi:hypothetical protein